MNTNSLKTGSRGIPLGPSQIEKEFPDFFADNYKQILSGDVIVLNEPFNTHTVTFIDKRSNISHVIPLI